MKTFLISYEIYFDENLVQKFSRGMGYFKVPTLDTVEGCENLRTQIKATHGDLKIKNLIFVLIRELTEQP